MLEIIALVVSLAAYPNETGIIGQGLVLRAWLGLVVGPMLLLFGSLIAWRMPGHPTGRLMILIAMGAVAMQFRFDPTARGADLAAEAVILFNGGLIGPSLGYLMLTFPTGRVYPAGWTRAVIAAGVIKFAGVVLEILATPGRIKVFAPTTNPVFVPVLAPFLPAIAASVGISGLLLPVIVAAGLVSLGLRYRAAPALEQKQIKWVVWGFGLAGPTGLATIGLIFRFGVASPITHIAFACAAAGQAALLSSIVIAVLRHRLFDIDLLINRTLVYALLTVIVVGAYVITVGYLSELFQATGSFVLSLLATGLIAVFFQPLRGRLQRAVNRLMYGERDDPYVVLSRLGQRLETVLAPEAVLPTLLETVAQALKLPYAAIELAGPEVGTAEIAAAYGKPATTVARLPLTYQSERVGDLLIAPRGPGESFTRGEQRLLADIAHEAGAAVHAVRLTADLQRSRERLVAAREEERRRLRRDLHDGLGPQLASQTLTLTAARQLLRQNPDEADALLAQAITHAQDAVTDIRRVVYELRPPALDDLGLVGALRAQAAEYEASGVRFSVSAPESLPPLPAAVEAACYRIAQEALTNVVKHAGARYCAVTLALDGALHFEVADDGRGLPQGRRAGVGLTSMRERAEELGGHCRVEPAPAGGTRVTVRLPLG